MAITMTEQQPGAVPAEESRGGEAPDWDQVQPGEPLPAQPDPETAALIPGQRPYRRRVPADWCGLPACGGD